MTKDFTMGADPEIGFLDFDERLNASSLISDLGNSSSFGLDGASHIGELRPAPSKNPLEVVENIRNSMLMGLRKFPYLKFCSWKAGSIVTSSEDALGGHVHFGLKDDVIPNKTFLTLILDQLLAYPVACVENREQAIIRRRGSYGKLSSVRAQPHGFEYRPLSSWLVSESAAKAVLCLSKAIAWEHINNESFNDLEIIHTDQHEYNAGDINNIRKNVIDLVIPSIVKLHLYETKYTKEIDWMLDLIKNGKCWENLDNFDVKQYWNLFVPISPKIVSLKKENARVQNRDFSLID